MKKLFLLLMLLPFTATAGHVEVYNHDAMNTRYKIGSCMVKTLRLDVYMGKRGHFTVVNKKLSHFFMSPGGRRTAFIMSTAGKAIIVGGCIKPYTTLDDAISTYQLILQHSSDARGDI